MTKPQTPTIREAVGVFQSEKDLQKAVGDLLTHGFNRAEISLLASEDVVENKMGHLYRRVPQLEDDTSVPRAAYIPGAMGDAEGAVIGGLMYVGAVIGFMPIVISGGAIAAAILAGAIGGGGGAAIGSILAGMIGKHHSDYIADQLERGGLLLWVRTWNKGDETRAVEILKKHSSQDVHLHGISDTPQNDEVKALGELLDYRGMAYEEAGPSEFYVSGKLFYSQAEAKAYIDRHCYVESLYDQARKVDFDLNGALIDPISVFHTLENLMAADMPKSIKIELLKRWAYYAKELEIASDDGMIAVNNGDRLQDIERAIEGLQRGKT